MEYYKLEKENFFQCFKIKNKIIEEGLEYYKYISIIIDPFGVKQMSNFMSIDDYKQLLQDFKIATEEEILNKLSEKIKFDELEKTNIYNRFFQVYLKFYTAKRKSRLETDELKMVSTNLDFF